MLTIIYEREMYDNAKLSYEIQILERATVP